MTTARLEQRAVDRDALHLGAVAALEVAQLDAGGDGGELAVAGGHVRVVDVDVGLLRRRCR
jgi:hypothetical protein